MGSRARGTPLAHPAVPWEGFLRVLYYHWGQPLFGKGHTLCSETQAKKGMGSVGAVGGVGTGQPATVRASLSTLSCYCGADSRGLHTAVPQSA